MATNNSLLSSKFSGSLGKELVFRNWQDKSIVAKAPGKRGKDSLTGPQKQVQRKFLMAARFAKSILEEPAMKKAYSAALKLRQNAFSKAVTDYLTPPEIEEINTRKYLGVPGDQIIVAAIDDFKVVGVDLEIRDASDILVERGAAVLQLENGINWVYTAREANNAIAGCKIKAIAIDVPGNETEKEVVI